MPVQWDYDLNFNLQPQQTTEWCFAAVAASISLWYDPSSQFTQWGLAGDQFGLKCEPRSKDPRCNVPGGGQLDAALSETGNYANQQQGIIDIPRLEAEFASGRLVAARVQWKNGDSAHFVVISNASAAQKMLRVNDPRPCVGTVECGYDDFVKNYWQGKGYWSDTYFTQRKGAATASAIPPNVTQAFAQEMQQSGGGGPANPATSIDVPEPRPVYSVDIDVLASGAGLARAELAGWEKTVLEPDGGAYTLHVSAESPGEVAFRSRSGSARERLASIHDATRLLSPKVYEVRLLSVPSVYVSALWLKAPADADDVIVPLGLTPIGVGADTHYDRATFEPILQELAQSRIKRPAPGQPVFR